MADFKLRGTLEFVPDPNARRNIRNVITRAVAGLEVRLERAKLSTGARRQLQREVSAATNVGTRGVEQAVAKIRNLQGQVRRTLQAAAAGIIPERALQGLTAAQQRATIEANRLQRQLSTLGAGASQGVTAASGALQVLRQQLAQVGVTAGTAGGQIQQLATIQARLNAAQQGTIATTRGVSSSVAVLGAQQQQLRVALEGSVVSTAKSTIANQRLIATNLGLARSQGFVVRGVQSTALQLRAVREQINQVAQASRGLQTSNAGIQSSFQGAGLSAETFGARLVTITARFATYLVAIRAILLVQQAFRESLDSIVEFDNVLQDLQKVIQETPQQLAILSEQLFDVAQITGRSITDVAESFGTFIRQGLAAEEALSRTQSALTATAISTLSQDEATKLITSSLQIFGDQLRDANELLDLISVTGDKAATNQTAIAQALLRTAGAADTAGVGFRELISLLAATIERTQEAAGKVGTAFKTIFTRIQANRAAFIENANALGANISQTDDLVTILGKLSDVFTRLDDVQKTQLATSVAGQRQVNIFVGLVESFNRAVQLQGEQTGAAGAAQAKLNVEQQKLSTQTQILVNNFKELIVTLAGVDEGADAVGGIRQSFSEVLSTLNTVISSTTEFVRSIQEVEAFGIRISGIFSSIGKLAFFAGGALLIRGIVRGIQSAVAGGRQLTSEARNITKALQAATGQVQNQEKAEQRVLQVERKREGVLRRILALSQRIATQQSRGGRAAAGGRGRGRGRAVTSVGGRALAGAGVIIAAGLVSDKLRELSDELSRTATETGDAGARQAAAAGNITASALELGVTFGILSGSIKGGILAGLIVAGIKLIQFARDQERNSELTLKAVEAEASARFNLESVLKTGSQDLEQAFRELASRSGVAAEEFVASAALISQIGFDNLSRDIDNELQSVAVVLRDGRTTLRNIFDTLSRQQARARAGEGFAGRISTARLAQEGGELSGPFREIDRIISSVNSRLETLTGQIGIGIAQSDILARSTEAINRANEEQTTLRSEILQDLLLEGPAIRQARDRLSELNAELTEEQDSLQSIDQRINAIQANQKALTEEANNFSKNLKKGEGAIQGQANALKALNDRLAEGSAREAAALKDRQNIQQQISQTEGLRTQANKEFEESSKAQIDGLSDILNQSQNLSRLASAIAEETNAQTVAIRQNVVALEDELQFEFELARQRRDGQTAAQQLGEIRVRAERQVLEALREEDRARAIAIGRIRQQAREAERSGDAERQRALESSANALEQAFERQRPELEAEIKAQVQIEVDQQLFQQLQDNERALTDSRISEIQRVTQAEIDSAQRRVDLLKRLGDTSIGRDVFERTLRNIPDQAAREFGRLNEAILRIQESSVSRFASGTIQEFRALEKVGISTAERLREAQQRQAEILERSQEQIDRRRQTILERVERASEALTESENELLQVRNQLPQANARVIEAQRSLAGAEASVGEATSDLISAFQDSADAQAELRFQTQLAVFQVRQQTGAFQSIGEQFSELERIFSETTRSIRVSEEQRLQLARQIAQEQLSLLQQQFNSLQSIGVRAATGTADELAKLQTAVGAAAAIAGGVSPGQFATETLQAVAGLGDLFPGLQRVLSEFGLEQLGVDPDTLENIEQEMIELARITAETGQEQVIAANEQIRAARQQLTEAEAARDLSQDQLDVAVDQKEQLLLQTAVAQAGIGVARANLNEVARQGSRTLDRLDSQVFATREVQAAVQELATAVSESRTDIGDTVTELREELGLVELADEVEIAKQEVTGFRTEIEKVTIASTATAEAKQRETITINGVTVAADDARQAFVNASVEIDNFIRKLSGFRPIAAVAGVNGTNQASGSLSSSELQGLISAARREKRAMPGGSRLMVANTSETVLTRRQASTIGLRPVPKMNAQDGNADPSALNQAVNTLSTAINNLNNLVSSPGLIQQDINVSVDSNRTINVRGVEAIDSAIRQLLVDRLGDAASREEVAAMGQAVAGLVQRLNEQGIVTASGA